MVAPPPPHDPTERACIGWLGLWEVRDFLPHDPRWSYFRARGLWHLQLWDARAKVSILKPSRITQERYEVFPIVGWKSPVGAYDDLRELVWLAHRVRVPAQAELEALIRRLGPAVPSQPCARADAPHDRRFTYDRTTR